MLGIYKLVRKTGSIIIPEFVRRRYRLQYRVFELKLAHTFGNVVSERIIEYPWILEQLKHVPKSSSILDVGCGQGASIVHYLQNRGYQSTQGIDILINRSVPNIWYLHNTNILKNSYQDGIFDVVILLSTLEHIGSDESRDDFRTIDEIHRILRKNGLLLFTTPYFPIYRNNGQRFYSSDRLDSLFKDKFQTIKVSYYTRNKTDWVEGKLTSSDYKGLDAISVIFMRLKKT